MNENQIADIWLMFVEYLDKKMLDSVAERYVELLSDHGISDKQIKAASGYDETLDSAISYYMDDGDEDDAEELGDWDDD